MRSCFRGRARRFVAYQLIKHRLLFRFTVQRLGIRERKKIAEKIILNREP